MWLIEYAVLVSVLALSVFGTHRVADARVPHDEVDGLVEMVKTMGATSWTFDPETSKVEGIGSICTNKCREEHYMHTAPKRYIAYCNHSVAALNLPGRLPSKLDRFPYLWKVDFAYNRLTGSIPLGWSSSLQLTSISLLVNQLSGSIPKGLGNFTSLQYLNMEVNQFSGEVPQELGKMMNLKL